MSEHPTAGAEKSVQRNTIPAQSVEVEERPSFRWRDVTLTKWRSPVLIWLCVACLPGLLLGLGAFLSAVGPLEKRLLDLEASGLARDIDSVVKVRIAAVKIAATGIEIDDLSEAVALDNLLTSFRSAFRDFLSLEVLNEHGEVLAMVGELPLSEARRFSGTERPAKAGKAKLVDSDAFLDDPKANCFFITAQHESEDGTRWFSRTRYTRDPIEKILSREGNQWTAGLQRIPDSDGEAANRKLPSGGFTANWLGNTDMAEARLSTAGWIVTLDKASKQTLLSKVPFTLVVLIALGAVLACLYRIVTTTRSPEGQDIPTKWSPIDFRARPVAEHVPSHPGHAYAETLASTQSVETIVEKEEDHDTGTPRNVPIGFHQPEESDSRDSETNSMEHTGLTTGEDQGQQERVEAAESSPSDDNASATEGVSQDKTPVDGATAADIPETLELSWLEPVVADQTSVEADVTDAPGESPQAETRMLSVPESMEVAWSEPAGDEVDKPDDEHHVPPSTFHSA